MRGRSSDTNQAPTADESRSTDASCSVQRLSLRRLLPLSIRTSLVVVVLIPLAVSVGLASTVVLSQSSIRRQATADHQATLVLDSLLHARAAVDAEYLSSEATVVAQSYHVSGSELDTLLGIDVQADLADARRAVDDQSVLGPGGLLTHDYTHLTTLRHTINQGTASIVQVNALFTELVTTIEGQWQSTFDRLSNDSGSLDSLTTRRRLNALGLSFTASTSGLAEDPLVEALLTTMATPAQVQNLIISNQQFKASVLGFPKTLGPKGTAAWDALTDNPLTSRFFSAVQLAATVGLGHETPPYATDVTALAGIAKSEAEWVTSLTDLVLASSADLRATTASQVSSATMALILTFLLMLLLVLVAFGGVLTLSRAIRRPLARVVAAAQSVRAGELDFAELDESGPKEFALAAGAMNEMSATLRAVQTQTIALAAGDLNDPVLQNSLPGRTGRALQVALDELQRSVRAREAQREVLNERATRDFLTGLLNREAALEALDLDLANVRRSPDELVLAVLFIDLDDLKGINDSLGHDGGDAALRAVGDALRAMTRQSDVVARFGGDEFVVGWLGKPNDNGPTLLAERICERVASSDVYGHGRSFKIGCSIGGALSEPRECTVAAIIERADKALYVAKSKGRGRVYWYAPELKSGETRTRPEG
jgi:diguanylate cyclase (GGDEF)-like protein